MPFETATEIQRLKAVIALPEVAAKPTDFAIGTLHGYQTKFEKIRRRAITDINKQLMELDPLEALFQEKMQELKTLELRPDWGFYYTLFLFDQLVDPSPNLINTMIQAVLSFDTLGSYLSETQPIIIALLNNQHQTVILPDILKRRRIDVFSLNSVAQKNRENTIYFPDSTIPVNTPLLPTKVSLLPELDQPSEKISSDFCALFKQVEQAKAVEMWRKRIAQVPFAFDLLSLEPTPENINRFFKMATELFNHAKMQDSAKLFTLNAAPYPNAKASKSSTVALLQDTMPSWFVLSLVQASTKDVFNQRLAFIVAVINTATPKKTTLPVNTTGDVFLPLFQFASYIDQSLLQFHPIVKSSLPHIKEMASKRSPDDIAKSIGGKIAPMRMVTTSQLVLNAEIGSMSSFALSVDQLANMIEELSRSSESQPLTRDSLSKITAQLLEIATGLSRIAAESFLPLGELQRITAALRSIVKGGAFSTKVAEQLSQIASDLTPLTQKLSPMVEVQKVMTQGRIIYNHFNPAHDMVIKPQPQMSDEARTVFMQQSNVKVLFQEADFFDMQNLLASTFVVFDPQRSIGRQLSALHNCLNLDSPRIYSLRDEKFYEGRGALDFIAKQAKRICDHVKSDDIKYVEAVNKWCATILNACQQGLDLASGLEMLGEEGAASSQNSHRRGIFDFFSRRRKRAQSEPPLPTPPLDSAARIAAFKKADSCPSSVNHDRRPFIKRSSGPVSHGPSDAPNPISPCEKK